MAGSIKLFQVLQKFHRFMGIHQSEPSEKQRLINWRYVITLAALVGLMISSVMFIVFEAKSSFDYGFASFMVICVIVNIAHFLVLIWQSKNTFKFIESLEQFIEKRKYIFEHQFLQTVKL